MYLLYSLFIIGFPITMSLSPLRSAARLILHNRNSQPPVLNATNATATLKSWPAVPFRHVVYDDFELNIIQLSSQTPLVHIWSIETALLDIYTNISFYKVLEERLPPEDTFTSDSGVIEVALQFSAAEGSRTIRYWQARRIVNALWDITASYNEPRQIARADLVVGQRVVGHLKMSFVPTIVGEGKPGGNVTLT